MMIFHYLIIISTFLHVYSISPDCPLVISLFQSLNMHNTDPLEFRQLPTNCCGFTSTSKHVKISCNLNNVTVISLAFLKIDGTISAQFVPPNLKQLFITYSESLKCTLPIGLPDSITILNFVDCRLTGNLPPLPKSLTSLTLDYNNLNGTLPTLPVNLTSIKISNNQFTGNLPTIPNKVTWLQISHNLLSGSLNFLPNLITDFLGYNNLFNESISKFPDKLLNLYIDANMIPGPLPNIWPIGLKILDMNTNQLNGTIPSSLINSNVTEMYLYNNLLSGTIDGIFKSYICSLSKNQLSGVITISQPIVVDISNNQFTNVIIFDYTDLNYCSLDNNPLDLAFANSSFASLCTFTTLRIFDLCRTN
eukprot:NODE_933_length_3018_cov_0.362453.p2 type:complete len:363 gc:universal NODE_933_length_3018_cov_0.362453:1425-2513(+)